MGRIKSSTRHRSKRNRKVHASFLHRGKWWVAWTDDVPGALTQGRTLDEARDNLRDAVKLMLEPANLNDVGDATASLVREVLEV